MAGLMHVLGCCLRDAWENDTTSVTHGRMDVHACIHKHIII